jgi:hypothetical protein
MLIDLYPSSIGEESYSSGTRNELTDEPTFCVDPIGRLRSDIVLLGYDSDFQMALQTLSTAFHLRVFLLG